MICLELLLWLYVFLYTWGHDMRFSAFPVSLQQVQHKCIHLFTGFVIPVCWMRAQGSLGLLVLLSFTFKWENSIANWATFLWCARFFFYLSTIFTEVSNIWGYRCRYLIWKSIRFWISDISKCLNVLFLVVVIISEDLGNRWPPCNYHHLFQRIHIFFSPEH